MKKIANMLRVVSVVVLVMVVVNIKAAAQLPRLQVQGNLIKDPYGNKVILRGMSLPDLAFLNYGEDNGWGVPDAITLATRMTDKNQGWYSNVLRLPIHADGFEFVGYRWTALSHDDFYNNHLRPFVDFCKQRGVYVIIDWHYVRNSYGNDADGASVDAKTREFWNYIAPRFANDDNVLFEVFNEPINSGESWDSYKNYVQPWVNIIRGHAPNTIIFVGGPDYSQTIGGSATNPVTGGNIAYVSHIYPFSGVDYAKQQAIQAASQAPVILGEFGWDDDDYNSRLSQRPTYPQEMKTMASDYSMGWLAWSATDNWYPGFLQSDYLSIKNGSGYTGGFLKQWLDEQKFNNQPCLQNCSGTNTPVTVRARSLNASGANLRIEIMDGTSVTGGTVVQSHEFYNLSTSFTDYSFSFSGSIPANRVRIRFTNDSNMDLEVDYIQVAGTTYQAEASTTYSVGHWNSANGCNNSGYLGVQLLYCNGYFHFGGSGSTAPAVATIYADALAFDWSDWSWSANNNISNTSTVKVGSNSISTTLQAWGALSLRKGSAQSTSGFTALKFWVHGGTATKTIRLYSQTADSGSESTSTTFTATANTWTEVTVNLSSLGNPSSIKRLNFQNNTGGSIGTFYLDDIRLVGSSAGRLAQQSEEMAREEEEVIGDLIAYPNPTTGMVTIQVPEKMEGDIQVQLTDESGNLVKQEWFNIHSAQPSVQIDMSDQRKGVFVVKVGNGKYQFTKKILRN